MLGFKLFNICQSKKAEEKAKILKKRENEMKNKMLAWLVTSFIISARFLDPFNGMYVSVWLVGVV